MDGTDWRPYPELVSRYTIAQAIREAMRWRDDKSVIKWRVRHIPTDVPMPAELFLES